MTNYRITKYDPKKRNKNGHYLDDSEWTSISDIGSDQHKGFTYKEYEKVESTYVNAIIIILSDKKINSIFIKDIELENTKSDFEKFKKEERIRGLNIDFDSDIKILKNNLEVELGQLDKIIRLILRETMWMILSNDNIEIRFGYDYYMYVTCEELKLSTIKQIEQTGLFVEHSFNK